MALGPGSDGLMRLFLDGIPCVEETFAVPAFQEPVLLSGVVLLREPLCGEDWFRQLQICDATR